jgi:hypothetical protein
MEKSHKHKSSRDVLRCLKGARKRVGVRAGSMLARAMGLVKGTNADWQRWIIPTTMEAKCSARAIQDDKVPGRRIGSLERVSVAP